MRIFRAIGLSVALAATASAASADMIEVDERGIAKSPFYNAQGEQLDAIPVMIRKNGDKAEIVAFKVNSDRDAVTPYGSENGILATWSIDMTVAEDIGFTFGVIIGTLACDSWDGPPFCFGEGVLLQVGAKQDSYRASVGYAVAIGVGVGGGDEDAAFLAIPLAGLAIKATLLKTGGEAEGWGDGHFSPSRDALYVGGEIDFTAILKFSVGLFKRVSANEELISLGGQDSDWLLNLGMGIGF